MNNIIYVPANYFMSYHIFQHYMAFGRDLACTIGQIGQGLLQQIQQDQQEPQQGLKGYPSLNENSSQASELFTPAELDRMKMHLLGTIFYFELNLQSHTSADHTPAPARRRISKKIRKINQQSKYKKKNTESNISNQIFSFICNKSKSKPLLLRILRQHGESSCRAINSFYSFMSVVKKNRCKYMNKKVIVQLCDVIHSRFYKHLQNSQVLKDSLPVELFSKTLRIMINYYLREMNPLALLTSKKIDRQTSEEHLVRRRQILSFITASISGVE